MAIFKSLKSSITICGIFTFVAIFTACKNNTGIKKNKIAINTTDKEQKAPKKKLSKKFKDYWYNGTAEITTYELEQARYGEIREGSAVMIFVTEPFLSGLQVKSDTKDNDNISVLKLNATKNYITGIYPYSIMTSSFYPVHDNQHALKLSFSAQEWCGHVYAQLNNRNDFEMMSHSYFESEADQTFNLNKTNLEDEIWNKLRINPTDLPIGEIKMIPSLEFIRLTHKELKAYNAKTSLTEMDGIKTFEITYPELERTLKINFRTEFPYTIESWTDTYKDGFGDNAKILTSTATIINRITTPYWSQNSNKDISLRDSLGL
ncbi:septum formation inhibitor Maf [Maribacter hydrothermalis]|uniref:Septum formation inhibitor Maf n=1 Tax=Maribacter hydrothermalis TaxID=1836467 RepID=A0A1B7Z8T5_9FLAO|nr:septum formation inhibitor Maf [Maribacter hydrothermalis]APQ18838.1 septum formation inhibitor Maf [Maribacter hydrothermalis]OBR39148.1 septum formation inhibitor Maf [Maribacter hydrothermalis]